MINIKVLILCCTILIFTGCNQSKQQYQITNNVEEISTTEYQQSRNKNYSNQDNEIQYNNKEKTFLSQDSLFKSTINIIWDGKNSLTENKYKSIIKKYVNKTYPQKVEKWNLSKKVLWQDSHENTTLKLTWHDANNYCNNLKINNSQKWSLPTTHELKNLNNHTINNYLDHYYWTTSGKIVDFKTKRVADGSKYKYYVRCIGKTSDISPYKNLSDKEKLSTITNFLIKKKLNASNPVYPKKPKKPTIQKAEALIKGRFERTAEFQKRVKLAEEKREKYISQIESDYKKEVLAYNKKNKELTDAYNKKIQYLKNNIASITANAMSQAYNIVYGKPLLKAIDYDADNEIFYGKLTSSRGDFSKNVAIKVPLNVAKAFYEGTKTPKVIYEYNDEKIFLKNIEVEYQNKNYLAMLTDTDYKSSDIQVALNTRDLNLKETILLSSTFIAQKSDFDIGKIDYGSNKIAKLNAKDLEILNTQRLKQLSETTENLASLLSQSTAVKKNLKAYAVIFGVEDYMLESNVNYSQNSAMMFMQYSSKLLGVPDDNIWAFVGNKTSSGFIKSQWNDFLSLVEPDATVYFYYSGHGVPGNDGNAYILPSDTNAETATNDKTFMLNNIYANLSKTKAKKVVAFVDSCFSGKDDKGDLLFDGVAPVLKVKKTVFDNSKMTIFTAGSSKHFSNQYKEKKQRLFSYFLMKGLAQGKTDTQELFSYVKKNVANKSRKLGSSYLQIPQLMGLESGKIR